MSTLSSSAFGTFILHLAKSASTWLPDLLLKIAFTREALSLHFLEILLTLIPHIFHLHLSPPLIDIKLLFHVVKTTLMGCNTPFTFSFKLIADCYKRRKAHTTNVVLPQCHTTLQKAQRSMLCFFPFSTL